MNYAILYFMTKILPFTIAFAEADAGGTATKIGFIDNLVQWAAGLGGGIIAIAIIISLVKDGLSYATGNGSVSVWQIVGKVVFLALCIGLIFVAINYNTLGNSAKGVGQEALNTICNEASKLVP